MHQLKRKWKMRDFIFCWIWSPGRFIVSTKPCTPSKSGNCRTLHLHHPTIWYPSTWHACTQPTSTGHCYTHNVMIGSAPGNPNIAEKSSSVQTPWEYLLYCCSPIEVTCIQPRYQSKQPTWGIVPRDDMPRLKREPKHARRQCMIPSHNWNRKNEVLHTSNASHSDYREL